MRARTAPLVVQAIATFSLVTAIFEPWFFSQIGKSCKGTTKNGAGGCASNQWGW